MKLEYLAAQRCLNIWRYQVLFWPRKRVAFFMPRGYEHGIAIFKIYRWIAYLWPIEVRLFKP